MFQWPVITILAISMFVGRVCPVEEKEGHNSTAEVATHINNTPSVSNDSSKKAIETTEDKKGNAGKVNETGSTELVKTSSKVKETTPQHIQKPLDNEKHNCNSTKEQEDMLDCYVTPDDNDDDDDDQTDQKSASITTEPTVAATAASNKTEGSKTESQTPKATVARNSASKNENSNEGIVVVPLKSTENAKQTPYVTAQSEPEHPTNAGNAEASGTNSKLGTNHTEASISTVTPLLEDNVPSAGSEEVIGAVKYTDRNKSRSMPSGVIALVTAISFAVAIAIVYIGMIIWRRYIEYRYGHRELLVNELEFDTNDLRHFEL